MMIIKQFKWLLLVFIGTSLWNTNGLPYRERDTVQGMGDDPAENHVLSSREGRDGVDLTLLTNVTDDTSNLTTTSSLNTTSNTTGPSLFPTIGQGKLDVNITGKANGTDSGNTSSLASGPATNGSDSFFNTSSVAQLNSTISPMSNSSLVNQTNATVNTSYTNHTLLAQQGNITANTSFSLINPMSSLKPSSASITPVLATASLTSANITSANLNSSVVQASNVSNIAVSLIKSTTVANSSPLPVARLSETIQASTSPYQVIGTAALGVSLVFSSSALPSSQSILIASSTVAPVIAEVSQALTPPQQSTASSDQPGSPSASVSSVQSSTIAASSQETTSTEPATSMAVQTTGRSSIAPSTKTSTEPSTVGKTSSQPSTNKPSTVGVSTELSTPSTAGTSTEPSTVSSSQKPSTKANTAVPSTEHRTSAPTEKSTDATTLPSTAATSAILKKSTAIPKTLSSKASPSTAKPTVEDKTQQQEIKTSEKPKTTAEQNQKNVKIGRMPVPDKGKQAVLWDFIVPVGIGASVALAVAFLVILVRTCRRRRLVKVRFGGKPSHPRLLNNDLINLLAESDDEEEE